MKFNLDTNIHPGDNFYQYVNSRWLKNNSLPDEETRWGSFNILIESNNDRIKDLLEVNLNSPNSEFNKASILYHQAMSNFKIDTNPIEVVKNILPLFKNIQSKDQLQNLIYKMFFRYGLSMPVNFSSFNDFNDANMNILHVSPGGLGLPDRDYYLDESKAEDLKKYRKYLSDYARLFNLSLDIDGIINLETEFAKNTYTNVQKRDPNLMDNPTTYSNFENQYPELNLNKIFTILNINSRDNRKVNVLNPNFLKNGKNGFIELWNNLSIELWSDYLLLHYLRQLGSYIAKSTEELKWSFYSKHLSGAKEMKPLWKRSIMKTESLLGMVVGKMYVSKYFTSESKERVLEMIKFMKNVFSERISNSLWMTNETKKKALEKLSKMNFKIGYPDIWRDFTNVDVRIDNSFITNVLNCMEFETQFDFSYLYKPTDKSLWFMDPQDVNAYYSPSFNEIVFPAGILQAPFYDVKQSFGANAGGIGAVIAHEMTHGFDDQGSRFDKNGYLYTWWSKETREAYENIIQKMEDHFNSLTYEDKQMNGKLTQGENLADLGGLQTSLSLCKTDEEKIECLLSWAKIWRANSRKEYSQQMIVVDPHSPPHLRINAIVQHISDFYRLFNVEKTDKMFLESERRCMLWSE